MAGEPGLLGRARRRVRDGAEDHDRAEEILAQIDERLEDTAVGTVASQIQQAKSHRSRIESTLGQSARRFEGLLPAYEANPQLVVQRLWAEAYRSVVLRDDAHVVLVPEGVGNFRLQLSPPNEIMERRRERRLNMREAAARGAAYDPMKRFQRARDMTLRGPGRQLNQEGEAPR